MPRSARRKLPATYPSPNASGSYFTTPRLPPRRSIPTNLADEEWVEDHLAITDVEPGRIWFEGDVGPIEVPRAASDAARPGWSMFVTAARDGGRWHLLEVGFVYP